MARRDTGNVRFGALADIAAWMSDDRFALQSGHAQFHHQIDCY